MNQKKMWEKKFREGKSKEKYSKPNKFAVNSLKLIRKLSPNAKDVLDLGCGMGRDSIFFARAGMNVTGIDFSPTAIKEAKNRAKNTKNIKFYVYDLSRPLKLKEKSFDAVYSHLVFHCITDKSLRVQMEKIYKILKYNGILIMRVKSIRDPYYGNGKKVAKDTYELKGHLRHFFSIKYSRNITKKFTAIFIKNSQYKGRELEYGNEKFVDIVVRKPE